MADTPPTLETHPPRKRADAGERTTPSPRPAPRGGDTAGALAPAESATDDPDADDAGAARRAPADRLRAALRDPRIVVPLAGLACVALGYWWGRAAVPPAEVAAPQPREQQIAADEAAADLELPEDFDWRAPPVAELGLPAYARFLKGVKIVIDPGHGGDEQRAGFKRSRWGLREAVVNLRVSLFLRDYMREAGAEVILTRETDVALAETDDADLAARAEIANRADADLLVSVHHNHAENDSANYSLVFFHGRPDEAAPSLAAARHVLTGLNDALRLDQHVDCAIRSDTTIYDSGFRLLRQTRVPAILVESSFYSNEAEEQRLRDPEYNRREAHGIFIGLARWAQAGLPSIAIREAAAPRPRGGRQRGAARPPRPTDPCVIELRDGVSDRGSGGPKMDTIRWETLRVLVNDNPIEPQIDRAARTLTLPWTAAELRGATLRVHFENLNGQPVSKPLLRFPD